MWKRELLEGHCCADEKGCSLSQIKGLVERKFPYGTEAEAV